MRLIYRLHSILRFPMEYFEFNVVISVNIICGCRNYILEELGTFDLFIIIALLYRFAIENIITAI